MNRYVRLGPPLYNADHSVGIAPGRHLHDALNANLVNTVVGVVGHFDVDKFDADIRFSVMDSEDKRNAIVKASQSGLLLHGPLSLKKLCNGMWQQPNVASAFGETVQQDLLCSKLSNNPALEQDLQAHWIQQRADIIAQGEINSKPLVENYLTKHELEIEYAEEEQELSSDSAASNSPAETWYIDYDFDEVDARRLGRFSAEVVRTLNSD